MAVYKIDKTKIADLANKRSKGILIVLIIGIVAAPALISVMVGQLMPVPVLLFMLALGALGYWWGRKTSMLSAQNFKVITTEKSIAIEVDLSGNEQLNPVEKLVFAYAKLRSERSFNNEMFFSQVKSMEIVNGQLRLSGASYDPVILIPVEIENLSELEKEIRAGMKA